MGRTGSLGGAGSLQAPTAQPRCFVVTTGDVVVRSSSEPLEQTEAPPQVWSPGLIVFLLVRCPAKDTDVLTH